MRVIVDRTRCQTHGQCEFAAPDVFSVGDDGQVHHPEVLPEQARPAVMNAAGMCPVQAITIED